MIIADKDGDLWRFSKSRNQLEVKLTKEGTGENEDGYSADEEWSDLKSWGDTPEIQELGIRQNFPELVEIIARCKENPEE